MGKPFRPRSPAPRDESWIWGLHAGLAALANPERSVIAVYATPNAAERLPPAVWTGARVLEPRALDALLPEGAVHQGLAVQVEPLDDVALDDVLAACAGPLLLLDQVTDPQNVGAIFRSCAAFGAPALIQQDRKSPLVTGALAKAAAGAIEQVADVRVVNVARAIEAARDAGFATIGLEGEAERDLEDALRGEERPILIVLGAEGRGMRDLVGQSCEIRARIAMPGGMESLNVSVAAAIALYAASRPRDAAKAAQGLVEAYLAASGARDHAAADAFLAPGAKLVFPGGARFSSSAEIAEWAAQRYRRIGKTGVRSFASPDGARVYVEGALFGQDLDGQVFSGVRFIDRFTIAGGRIVEQQVWNDLAEAGVTAREG